MTKAKIKIQEVQKEKKAYLGYVVINNEEIVDGEMYDTLEEAKDSVEEMSKNVSEGEEYYIHAIEKFPVLEGETKAAIEWK
jgi:hypothetical protein